MIRLRFLIQIPLVHLNESKEGTNLAKIRGSRSELKLPKLHAAVSVQQSVAKRPALVEELDCMPERTNRRHITFLCLKHDKKMLGIGSINNT